MSGLNIELPILESIKHAQMQHGLKYENYRNYRSYCSRRLHRIRRSLNVAQGVAPSAKARHQRARKLMDVTNEMILEAGEKNQEYAERVLLIPLCLAERAWSYAMQLKQDVADQPRKRFHLVRRLQKAAKYASKFEQLCHDPESPCLERTKQEATAYACYVNGLYKLERENWAEAKEDMQKALTIYFTLSLSISKEEVLEHYRQRIEELRASLKYCAFNLGEKDKNIKVKLPQVLQFHDIAFRHAKQIQEQEVLSQPVSASPKKTPEKPVELVSVSPTKMEVDSPKKASPSKTSATKAPAVTKTTKKPSEEEDEDEFEETKEAIEEDDEEEEEEDSDESEDDDRQQSRPGGVTGFVKGWLGGAWS